MASIPEPDSPSTSKSGIVTDSNGQRHIPSSVRADGTKRKEIKIRPGYRPPEDVEVYKNRTAHAFRNRGQNTGVPGADIEKGGDKEGAGTAASNKNAKRREARKRAKANAGEEETAEDGSAVNGEKQEKPTEEPSQNIVAEQAEDPEAEKEKKAKKIRKKLREARDLQQKKERGEGLLPEQLQKAIRIKELVRELEQMGLNAEEENTKAE